MISCLGHDRIGQVKVLEQWMEMGDRKGVGEKREEDDYIDQGISTI